MPESPRTLVTNAPVTTLTTAESVVAAVLTFLTAHGVFGDIDISSTTQTVAPFVALALPALFGAVKWRLVTPFAKVKDMAERDGLVSDADMARIGELLEERLQAWGLEPSEDVDDDPLGESEEWDDSGVDTDVVADDDPALVPEVLHHPEHAAADAGHIAPRGMSAGGLA